jgi:hypothetical protein
MKKSLLLLVSVLWAVPVLAADLQPEIPSQAIREYKAFSKTENPDPGNHVIWKLYIYRAITQTAHPDGAPEYFIAGLTPFPRDGYFVRLKINELYNYLHPVPERGEVILAAGRIINYRDYEANLPNGKASLKLLAMDLDGAVSLPQEHFDPSAKPSVGPGYGIAAAPANIAK